MVEQRQGSVRSSGSSNSSHSRNGGIKLKKLNHNLDGIDNENYVDDESNPVKQNGGHTVVVTTTEVDTKPADKDWDPPVDEVDTGPAWSELTSGEKAKRVSINISKIILLIGLLYLFICSLDLLGSSFRLLAGRAAGELFQNNELLQNPVAGLMIGVLVTVLLQSSSTSTSIVVAMVGSGILTPQQVVYIIMGANIGTSVTSTIVAMSQAGDRDVFRRAFAGGTVHDMFNWLTVLVLLPLEAASGYLFAVTEAITSKLKPSDGQGVGEMQFLQEATRPFTDLIVQGSSTLRDINSYSSELAHPSVSLHNSLTGIDQKMPVDRSRKIPKFLIECFERNGFRDKCSVVKPLMRPALQVDEKGLERFAQKNNTDFSSLLLKTCNTKLSERNTSVVIANLLNTTDGPIWNTTEISGKVTELENVPCEHLFMNTDLTDTEIGLILLFVSLFIICGSLVVLVKLLGSMLKGSVAKVIKKTVNYDLPKPFGFLTGYIALLVGAGLTIIVQSSSVFTSTLTPLVGLGVISIERMYPLTLGSNIGTTATSVLAALASSAKNFHLALQTSLIHLFFNCSGVLLWYSIPWDRKVPIGAAKILGNTTAKYRWFALIYILLVFLVLPGLVFGLSMAGPIYLGVIGGLLLLIFLLAVIVNALQKKAPRFLPRLLENWEFLPRPLHSLKPADRVMRKILGVLPCCKSIAQDHPKSTPTVARTKITETAFFNGNAGSAKY